jgi:hypothetical protein
MLYRVEGRATTVMPHHGKQPLATETQTQKRATEVALFNDQAELSSVWPLLDAAVPP